jgi:hypothetical protein
MHSSQSNPLKEAPPAGFTVRAESILVNTIAGLKRGDDFHLIGMVDAQKGFLGSQ